MPLIFHLFKKGEWNINLACHEYGKPKTHTVYDWALITGAELVFNLGLFNMSTGESCTYVKNHKGELSYGGRSDNLEVSPGNITRGYANLIKDDAIVKSSYWLGGTALRNGVGITKDGDVIVARTTDAVSEMVFGKRLLTRAKKEGMSISLFVLQDGGGSTSEYSAISKLIFYPQGARKVASVLTASRIKHPCIARPLIPGCKGEDVKYLQMILGGLDCDGIYGSATKARVKEFQKVAGFKGKELDGKCGPLTQKKLGI